MPEAIVTARALRKSYRCGPETITPIADLDVTVMRGSVVALIGPSGSGKSTLLHCLAGIERPDAGQLTIAGVAVSELTAAGRDRFRARSVGLVFQSFHLVDVLDARANVLLGLAGRRPQRADRERAEALLTRVGLGDRLAHRPGQLSGGQQQRVAIARALIHRPPLVLADEPTGNLDASGADAITALLIDQAREEGATVLIVTHDLRVADRADRCLHLQGGRLHEAEAVGS